MNQSVSSSKIAEHIFNGSTTMAGVSITVIALFNVMNKGLETYADEILSANTCMFIVAALLAYIALRNNRKSIEVLADIFFFGGMVTMMLVGLMIVYTSY